MKVKRRQHDVFFVDDEAGIRRVVSEELKTLNCNVSCFANAADCLEQLPKKNCNLLITDVKMPGMDGLTLLSRAKRVAPWVSVMLITGYGDIPMCIKALTSGEMDFVEKPLERKAFLHKVKTILGEDDFAGVQAHHVLTKTEKKVLKLILEGMGNKEIAFRLGRALRTVERHRSDIMHKFGVDKIVELVKKAAAINLNDVE